MEKFNSYDEYFNFTLNAPDEQFWDKSFLANTKQAYEIYLKEYPNGLHVKEAKGKIDEFIAIEKDHKAFDEAKQTDTKASYELYLRNYSIGLHVKEAKEKIDECVLRDNNAYDKALHLNTKQAYEIYLKEYPNGLHAKESKNKIEEFIAIEKDEQAFADALKMNTKASYESYLKNYPNGLHVKEAKNKIDEFIAIEKDHDAFHRAQKTNTKDAYKAYVSQYPNGLHVKEAQKKIEEIQKAEQLIADDHKAFEKAKQLNTKEGYKTYLDKYPNGRFAKEAQNKIDTIIKAEKTLAENEAFKVAQKKDTKEAYKAYVSQYPNGLHVKEAKSKIEEIQKVEQLIADDHKAFETAKQKNTKDAYESYLKFYNNGIHRKEALTKIGEFDQEEQRKIEVFRLEALKKQKEEAIWQEVKKENTIKSYESYLEQYPNGLHEKEAQEAIATITKAEKKGERWNHWIKLVIAIIIIAGVKTYFHMKKIEEERIVQEIEWGLQQEKRDNEAFEKAKLTDTLQSYKAYAIQYPNGQHIKESQEVITVKEKKLKIFTQAEDLYAKKRYKEALDLFKQIEDEKNAYFYLGYLYKNIDKNYKESLKFYTKSCDQNDSYSCNNLGNMFERGEGVSKDNVKALQYYNKASNLDSNFVANCNVADMYYYEKGTKKNITKAKEFLAKGFPDNEYCQELKKQIETSNIEESKTVDKTI